MYEYSRCIDTADSWLKNSIHPSGFASAMSFYDWIAVLKAGLASMRCT